MKNWLAMLLIVGMQPLAVPLAAADTAWILSIPHAVSDEGVYKVQILEIDGAKQNDLIRYPATPGRHVVRLRMLLQVEWDPDLAEAPRGTGWKELEVVVEPGKSYQLAARINLDAPIEAQLDQSYWEPFVYQAE
jgi:hypothetical protein